jgi:hypothetical protein
MVKTHAGPGIVAHSVGKRGREPLQRLAADLRGPRT